MDRALVFGSALGVCLLTASGCANWAGRNPFGEPAISRNEPRSDAGRGAARSSQSRSGLLGNPKDALHDPLWRDYIESELFDASPEERTAMLETLKGKSPEVARDMLRGRRIRIAAENRPARNPIGNSQHSPAVATVAAAASSPWSAARPESSETATSQSPLQSKTDSAAAPRISPKVDPHVQPITGRTALPARLSQAPRGDLVPNQYQLQPSQGAPRIDPSVVPAGDEKVAAAAMQPRHRRASTLPVLEDVAVDELPNLDSAPAHSSLSPRTGFPPDSYEASTPATPATPAAAAPASPTLQTSGTTDDLQPIAPLETPPTPTLTPSQDAVQPLTDWSQSNEFRRVIDSAAQGVSAHKAPTDAEASDYIRQHVNLRMLYLMSGQSERAVESIPGIAPADQMFWQQTLWGMHNYFDEKNIPSPDERATQTVLQFTNAAQRLQERASLQLRNVTFCQQISSFGAYDRFPQYEFTPGQQVLLYAEVDNFHSEETDSGQQFRTILKSSVEIYRAGVPGDPEKIELPVPATEDVCRNRRRDYFHTYEFVIPPRLQPGPHVLRLTVEDTLTRKVATATVNFTVK